MPLCLVQQGMAKSNEEDPDRHFTQKGLQDVQEMAEFVQSLTLLSELCSIPAKPEWASRQRRWLQL